MTPRELFLKLEGQREHEAFLVILNRRASTENNVTVNSLLGRENEPKFGTWEEREKALKW